MEMKQEKSCGAIVFIASSIGRLYLIEEMIQGHFTLPKGHVEKGEDEYATATREIREETGLKVEFIPGFRFLTAYNPYPGIHKNVVYFLAKAIGGQLTFQPEELKSIRLLAFREAQHILTYPDDKKALESAEQFINNHISN